MAGIIPRPFIDDLLDRVDIVEVIDHRVKLKKAGKNYSACCPFHDEKTPSFTVSPDKQFYYCFGCGASGNAVGFLMEYERLNFPEAVENLAHHLGIEVPREQTSDPKQRAREQAQEKARNSLYELMEAANDFYQQQLRQHNSKQQAVEYLKNRGLTGQIAKAFGIGYAPPGWDNLFKELATSNEKQERLLEAGMLIHNEEKDSLYDRFRNRIMFPIRDTRGRVIGFGGRVLGDDKPKYLNSPETPIFHKGKELYGLYEARQAYKQLPRLLVVEGYMDVVALAQYGINYGVATLGTACGEEHLQRGFRFTNEIVFCFDGDQAGRKAARRAMEIALPAMEDGRQVKLLYLPEGEDPDTLIRQIGTEKFTRLIEGATPLESFVFEELGKDINTQTMEGRARLCKLAAPLLDRLPRGIYRELMFNQLANRTQLSMDALMTLLTELPAASDTPEPQRNRQASRSTSSPKPAQPETMESFQPEPQPLFDEPEPPQYKPSARLSSDSRPSATKKTSGNKLATDERAIALLLYQPALAANIEGLEVLEHSKNPNIKLLLGIIELLKQRPNYSCGQILGHWQGTYGPESSHQLQELLTKSALFHQTDSLSKQQQEHRFNPESEFTDAIRYLCQQQLSIDCQNIIQQLNSKPIHSWTEAEKQLYSQAIGNRNRT